ncbi:hypothetical protein ACA910_020041 [Epithemia clementina (nom. ined.)]
MEHNNDSSGRVCRDDNNGTTKHLNSFVSIVGSYTSIVTGGLFYAALVWKRDCFMTTFFLGATTNAILAKVLKKMIKQTRPPDMVVSELRFQPSDGGMPSSHAMSLGFIGTFLLLHEPLSIFPVLIFTAAGLLYRVQVKLHTWEQIAVGVVAGSANALCFYNFAKALVDQFVNQTFLNKNGLLPYPFLIVPTVVGVVVVGSVKRRITSWMTNQRRKRNMG